jgi:hypothetical protein
MGQGSPCSNVTDITIPLTINNTNYPIVFDNITLNDSVSIISTQNIYFNKVVAFQNAITCSGSYVEINNSDLSNATSFGVSAGKVLINSSKTKNVAVSGGVCTIFSSPDTITPSCSAGTLYITDSNVFATTPGGIAASSTGTGITYFSNVNFYDSNMAPTIVSLAGTSYSFSDVLYKPSGSTLTASDLGIVSYSDALALASPLPVGSGGTGLATLASSYVPYGNGTGNLNSASTFTFNGTALSSPSVVATGSITPASNAGAISYGTIGFTQANLLSSFSTSVNSECSVAIQNSNSGSSAQTSLHLLSNVSSAYLVDGGKIFANSSTFSASPNNSTNAANVFGIQSGSGSSLSISTWGGNNIIFTTNAGSATSDALAINGSAAFKVNGSFGTAGYIFTSGGSSASVVWTNPTSIAVTSISGGTTGLTPSSATQGAVTLSGTLAVANGGTGATAQPTFYATATGGQSVSTSTPTLVQFNGATINVNSNFSTSTYLFTPTVAGYYSISALVTFAGGTSATSNVSLVLQKNTSTVIANGIYDNTGGRSSTVSSIVQFNGSTDYVSVYVTLTDSGAQTLSTVSGQCVFSGHFIHT